MVRSHRRRNWRCQWRDGCCTATMARLASWAHLGGEAGVVERWGGCVVGKLELAIIATRFAIMTKI